VRGAEERRGERRREDDGGERRRERGEQGKRNKRGRTRDEGRREEEREAERGRTSRKNIFTSSLRKGLQLRLQSLDLRLYSFFGILVTPEFLRNFLEILVILVRVYFFLF
jgi:hypothetical protein